jgi:molecular chaperone GrpE
MWYDFGMTKKDDHTIGNDDLMAKVAAAQAGDSAVSTLEKQVEDLQSKLQAATEVASRASADLQNAKARMEKEAGELRKFVAEGVILRLLPTIDNLQRAVQHLPAELTKNEWVKGVVALEKQLLSELQSLGLSRFESVGQPIDPTRHEVLMQVEGKEGAVVDVIEDGYELNGKVIRPAKVKAGGG